jgi:hypothetical protein
MNLATAMSTMATRLGTIAELNAYGYPIENVAVPAAVVGFPEDYSYDATMGRGSDRMTLPVFVLVGKVSDRASRDTLADYVNGSGSKSVKATLETGTYTAFDTLRVESVSFETVSVAGIEYLAGIFDVMVFGDGST